MNKKELEFIDSNHVCMNSCGISSAKYLNSKREFVTNKKSKLLTIKDTIFSKRFFHFLIIWLMSYLLFSFVTLLIDIMWVENSNIFISFAESNEILFTNVSLVFSLLTESVSTAKSNELNQPKTPTIISTIYLFLGTFIYAIECANKAKNSQGIQYLPDNQFFGDFTTINIILAVGAFLIVMISKIVELMPRENTTKTN